MNNNITENERDVYIINELIANEVEFNPESFKNNIINSKGFTQFEIDFFEKALACDNFKIISINENKVNVNADEYFNIEIIFEYIKNVPYNDDKSSSRFSIISYGDWQFEIGKDPTFSIALNRINVDFSDSDLDFINFSLAGKFGFVICLNENSCNKTINEIRGMILTYSDIVKNNNEFKGLDEDEVDSKFCVCCIRNEETYNPKKVVNLFKKDILKVYY